MILELFSEWNRYLKIEKLEVKFLVYINERSTSAMESVFLVQNCISGILGWDK